MASTLTIEAHRRRFAVKAGPMAPLSALVADVLGQLKLAGEVRPEDCQLLLKGKPLDISTPVRFANVGREKLELKTGREQVLGFHEPQRPAGGSAAPTAPAPQQVVPLAHPAASAPAPATAVQQQVPQVQQQQQQQQQQAAAVAQPLSSSSGTHLQAPSHPAVAAAMPGSSSATPAAAAATATAPGTATPAPSSTPASAPAPGPPADEHPSVALFGRRVWVFTRQAEQQAEGGAQVEELEDSFYDFNEADLRRAMASQAAARAKQEGGHLMTAAMREREERRRAESYGEVPIRLYLPDGSTCLQTSLPATAPLSAVLALARAALAPAAAPPSFLFTTPPRTVLKDLSLSLFAAKMIPAAKVHVGLERGKVAAAVAVQEANQLLRPEVLALLGAPPQRAEVMHARRGAGAAITQQVAEAPGGGGQAGGAAAARGGGASGAAQVQKGVPKWLKLGGK